MLKQGNHARTMTSVPMPQEKDRREDHWGDARRMGQPLILALDQGTTSTRAILFQADGKPVCDASRPLRQSYPRDGWVEHDADEIYAACVGVLRDAVEKCD